MKRIDELLALGDWSAAVEGKTWLAENFSEMIGYGIDDFFELGENENFLLARGYLFAEFA